MVTPICRANFLYCLVLIAATLTATAAHGAEPAVAEDLIKSSTPVAVAFMLSMLVMKVTAFVIGYLIVKLGHDTLIKGVTGDIDFGFSGSGVKTKLKSASPGALFVLMGAAIIIWGLAVSKPMTIKSNPSQVAATDVDPSETRRLPPVPN